MKPHLRWVCGAALVIAIGGWLRLYQLGDMEFKGDEQEVLNLADELIAARSWRDLPTHGNLSSNRVSNPPLFTWIVAAVWQPTGDPVAVARAIAIVNTLCLLPLWLWARRRMDESRALITLAIIAVSPFAVLYSRKIWQPYLLFPGVLAVLWGIEWLRTDRLWKGLASLVFAALVAGQLHQSGPIALALLPIAVGLQWRRDRLEGVRWLAFRRPTVLEAAALILATASAAFFWLPYMRYLTTVPASVLSERPHAAWYAPYLLWKVIAQVSPVDLFYFFGSDRADFLDSAFRLVCYSMAVAVGGALAIYGAWRWLRAPHALPVLGWWWIGVILAFAVARIPTFPYYALILAPLPALLAGGGFDPSDQSPALSRVLTWSRVIYACALLTLSASMLWWIHDRGGSSGDYGVAYRIKAAQGRAIVSGYNYWPREHFYELHELMEAEQRDAALTCRPFPVELTWIMKQEDRGHPGVSPVLQICEAWMKRGDRVTYGWTLR